MPARRHRRASFLALLALPLAALAWIAACAATPEGATRWRRELAFESPSKLGGCVVADLDVGSPGGEIAVTAGDGKVHALRRGKDGWERELVLQSRGEMIQCAAGDVDPTNPGDELIVVGALEGGEDDGGRGAAYIAWREAGGWRSEPLLEDDALLHAVCVGDVDPDRPGLEVVVAGYARRVHLLAWRGGTWTRRVIGELPGDAKGAAAGLGGVVLACADGSLVLLRKGGADWSSTVLERFPAPLARVAAREGRVLFCGNDGELRLFEDGAARRLYRSEDRLRGAVFANFDPGAGSGYATAGYDGRITVIGELAGGGLATRQVAEGAGRYHHLATGSLPGIGPALVGCGYAGEVVVLWPERD